MVPYLASAQKMLSDDTHIVLLPKMAHDPVTGACDNTQKMLSNDTHIIYYQKRK
jgi:hypothetical protein